jgi:DNA-binding phage protein
MDKEKTNHEVAMEHAKEMLDKHKGMAEISSSTGLNERNINKVRRKLNDKD